MWAERFYLVCTIIHAGASNPDPWQVQSPLLPLYVGMFVGVSTGEAIPVRLNAGKAPSEGRLEVWYNNTWGTVCDDGFTDATCVVVCRQLGLRFAASHFGIFCIA